VHLHWDERRKGRAIAIAIVAIVLVGQTQKAIAGVDSSKSGTIISSEITAYSPNVDECDGNPFRTASGQRVRVGGIAADVSVLPFGSLVLIPNYNDNQPCQVIDTGGAIVGTDIDVFFWTKREAIQWGRRKHVLIKVLRFGKGDSTGLSNPVSRGLSRQRKGDARIVQLLKESLRPMRVLRVRPPTSFISRIQTPLSGRWSLDGSFTKTTATTSIFFSSQTLVLVNFSTLGEW
jgi:3D (Asp-Asp-Asp) domain-containing protein